MIDQDNDGKQQGSQYNDNQADYGSPRSEAQEESQGQDEDSGMSKEEWLRQNPGQGDDPAPAPGEGMSKEDYLRQTQLDARDDSRH